MSLQWMADKESCLLLMTLLAFRRSFAPASFLIAREPPSFLGLRREPVPRHCSQTLGTLTAEEIIHPGFEDEGWVSGNNKLGCLEAAGVGRSSQGTGASMC